MKLERNLAIEDYKKFTLDQLAEASTVEMLILKGHIPVEYGMNLYLESISHNNDSDFSKENFTFAQKLTIVKHFSKIGIRNDSILPEVYLLNKLRNQIAHTLTFEKKTIRSVVYSDFKKIS